MLTKIEDNKTEFKYCAQHVVQLGWTSQDKKLCDDLINKVEFIELFLVAIYNHMLNKRNTIILTTCESKKTYFYMQGDFTC